MPVEVSIDKTRGLVSITISGMVGMDAWLARLDSILSLPEYETGMSGLIDIRQADHQTGIEDIARMARYLVRNHKKIKGARIAVIAGATVSYGLMRMLETQVLGLPFKFRVFYDMDEGRRWLGLTTSEGETDG
jgi:hypothetical protein